MAEKLETEKVKGEETQEKGRKEKIPVKVNDNVIKRRKEQKSCIKNKNRDKERTKN